MSTTVSFIGGGGAGDMAVVEAGDGKSILIDCSIHPGNQADVMCNLFLLLDAGQFDMFIALNVAENRVQGLSAINDRFYIRKMWDAGIAIGADGAISGYKSMRTQAGVQEIDGPVLHTFASTRLGLVRAVATAKADMPGGPLILRIADVDAGEEHGAVLFMSDATPDFWDEAFSVLPLELLRADVVVAGGHGAFGLGASAGAQQIGEAVEILAKLNPSVLVIADNAFDDAEKATVKAVLAAFSERCSSAEIIEIGETGPAVFQLSAKGVSVEIDDQRRPVERLAS